MSEFYCKAFVTNKGLLTGWMSVEFWVLAKDLKDAYDVGISKLNEMLGNDGDEYDLYEVSTCGGEEGEE